MKVTPAIVLVTTSFPIGGDGSEAAGSFVSDLAEELARQVKVRVVAPGPQSIHEMWGHGVEVFRYASPSRPLSTLKPWRLAEMRDTLRVLRAGAKATSQAVRAGPTAHILALWVLPSGYWARSASRATGVPYSIWALGSDIWSLGRIPGVRMVLRSVMRGAVHRYADGLQLGRDAADIGGKPFEFLPSTRRLNHGRTRPLASSSPYRLLFLGRWHTNKGVDLMLEALTLLDAGSWSHISEVHIAGGGPMEGLVREKVGALQAKGRPVRLSGYLDREQASTALSEADYLLIPSRIESIPVVFSDAMKMQLPVISTPVGDLPALVTRYGVGVLASRIDAAALAEAMQAAINRSPAHFSAEMTECARQFLINTRQLGDELGFKNLMPLEDA